MNMKKKIFAIGVACGLSFNLGAQAPSENNILFGTSETLVVEQAAPVAGETTCTGNPELESTECWSRYRAVLSVHLRKVLVHGKWT